MNKIRKYLIHLLGGVTEEEALLGIQYAIRKTGAGAADAMLLYMKNCNGLHPDEWCKKVYDYTLKTRERAVNELSRFIEAHPNEEMEVNDGRS